MKKVITFLGAISFLIITGITYAQEIPPTLKNHSLYSNSKNIINGTKWIYKKKYKGIPFLSENSWATANINYNGEHFENVKMNFNLFTNELIIYIPEEGKQKFVVISKDYLEGFSFIDSQTQKNRLFEYFQLPGTKKKQLYEIAYQGKSRYLVRHNKNVNSRVTNGFLGEYVNSVELYLNIGNGFQSFSKKKSLLNIMEKQIPELKKFIRKNKLTIREKYWKNAIPVIEYFDSMIK